MKLPTLKHLAAALISGAVLSFSASVSADMLDDIISRGSVKCGIMLDVPPAGMRDNSNRPIGYDVDFCRDMAEALGVKAVIVETPSPDRIPAILSGRVDVGVASATNSLQRAKSVAFSIPYQIWATGVAINAKDNSIKSYADLKGKKVGTVRGTSSEVIFLKDMRKWRGGTKHVAYNSNAEQFLALSQGKVDAIIEATAILGGYIKNKGKGKLKYCCIATSVPADWTALMVPRKAQGLLNWIDLFVWHQMKNGRTDELYRKWFGHPAPDMAHAGVHGY